MAVGGKFALSALSAARAFFAAAARALLMAFCSFSTLLRASLAALRASLNTLGAFLCATLARSKRLLASSALCRAAFSFSVTGVTSISGFLTGAFLAFIYVSSFACEGGRSDSQIPEWSILNQTRLLMQEGPGADLI